VSICILLTLLDIFLKFFKIPLRDTMLCCIINIVLEIVGDELTIYRICEELFNMKDTFKKYLYLAGSLFLAFALSIVLFFVLYKIDAIKSVIGHIVKTMMPFIIGAL
jgi:hypothetical protein